LRAFAYAFIEVKFCLRPRGSCHKFGQELRKVRVDGSRCENFDLGLLEMPTGGMLRGICVVVKVMV
jgi:hypothetical protein